MKILLIGVYDEDGQVSLKGFSGALCREMKSQGISIALVNPPAILNRLSLPNRLRKWTGYLDKFVFFPFLLKHLAREVDIVHICEQGGAWYTKFLKHQPHLVTCHDLLGNRAARGEFSFWPRTGATGKMLQRMIINGLRTTQNVICSSEATKTDVLRLVKNNKPPAVIYLGLFYPYTAMLPAEQDAYLTLLGVPLDYPFLMHIGSNAPTKNRKGMLAIFERLRATQNGFENHRLVITGKSQVTLEMAEFICNHGMRDKVIELSNLNNEQIRALYSRAAALVFPSLGEGFGMPIIEAQSCGCPVFTSDIPPMTEVGGDAAVYFDPQDTEGAARIISQTLNDIDKLQEMKVAGLANVAARFTTERMVADYRTLYEQILIRSGRDN